MKKVLLRAPVLTQSGYGVHARQVAKWLLKKKSISLEVQALPWGDTPWLIDGTSHGGLIGEVMSRTVDPAGKKYDVTFQLQLPNEWDPNLGRVNVGITAGVETDRCNPEWVTACNKMTHVVVPSRHSESSITNTGKVEVSTHVVPESFSEAIERESSVSTLPDFSTKFNFLVFGQLTGNNPENDRKNIFYTVKWLCEAFKHDVDVGIVVKTNAGRNTAIDRRTVRNLFEGLVREVRRTPFPKVHLLHGDMTDEEVSALYRHPQLGALVALTRGEGYGLPILEAAASGLPVVATGWSGHVDFLETEKYVSVDHGLVNVHPSRVDDRIFMKGSRWAQPVEEDFKRKIVKLRNDPKEARSNAASLRETIRSKYSIDSVEEAWERSVGVLL